MMRQPFIASEFIAVGRRNIKFIWDTTISAQDIILGFYYIRKSIIADPGIAIFYNRIGVVEKAEATR